MKNKYAFIGVIVIMIYVLFLGFASRAYAQTTMTAEVRWSNCNVLTTPHPKPLDFTITPTGYHANLEDGSEIVYTWINDTLLLEWEDAWAVIDESGFRWGKCFY